MSTQIQKSAAQKPARTIKTLLEGEDFKRAVGKALPKHCTPDRFVRIAITATLRTPKLLECSQESLFNALLTLSQFGLEPDGRRAHLVPFGKDCTLIVDYKGLAEMAYRSGFVSTIHADVICENDEFDYDLGRITKHKINFREDRGSAYAAYAICRFKDGTEKCEVMPVSEIDQIMERSSGYRAFKAGYTKSNPWETDWREMAKKTVFRRLSKWLPLSAEFRDALEAEDSEADRFNAAKPVFADAPSFLPEPAAQEPGNASEAATSAPQPEQADQPPTGNPAEKPDALNASEKPTSSTVKESVTVAATPNRAALAAFLTENEFTFSAFQNWAVNRGFQNADTWICIDEVPEPVAAGIMRKKSTLQADLKEGK